MPELSIRNWYCPHCEEFLSMEDVKGGRHANCQTLAEWRERIVTVETLAATVAEHVRLPT